MLGMYMVPVEDQTVPPRDREAHQWPLLASIWGRSFFASAIVFLLPLGEFNIF
jgi:hypothetical protein